MIRTGTLLDADMRTLMQSVANGWRWWVHELAGMLPQGWRARRRRLRPPLVAWSVETGLEIGDLATGAQRRAAAVTIVLDRALLLERSVELPATSIENLRKLVALDLDRLFPFGADSAYCDVAITGPGSNEATVSARVAILPKRDGLAVVDALAEYALTPRAIVVADGDAVAFDFLPAIRTEKQLAQNGQARAGWWMAVVLLFVANLGVLIYSDIAATRQLETAVADQSFSATAARTLAATIARENRSRAELVRRRQRADALAILALASRAMPDGAWVQRFSWSGNELRLSGYKQPDVDLVPVLRRTGSFKSIRTTSSEVATDSADGQPFDITATLGALK